VILAASETTLPGITFAAPAFGAETRVAPILGATIFWAWTETTTVLRARPGIAPVKAAREAPTSGVTAAVITSKLA
jgi:hypothetical protein